MPRIREDIEIVIRLPKLRHRARNLNISRLSPEYQLMKTQRRAVESRLRIQMVVKDPRDFENAARWRDEVRKTLGLSELGMCINALCIPNPSIV